MTSEWKVLFEQNYWGSHEIDAAAPALEESEEGCAQAVQLPQSPAREDVQEIEIVTCTQEHRMNQMIDWYGETWELLSFYTCQKGLVLDYCKKIDPEKLQAFTRRFQAAGFDGNHFDEELFERIQLDNPTSPGVEIALSRDGAELSSMGSSSLTYVPGDIEDQENDPVALLCMEHYGLDMRYGWVFSRAHYAWDEGHEEELSGLTAVLDEREVTLPGEHFHLTGKEQKLSLTHPVSGERFDLCIARVEAGELGQETLKLMDTEINYPTHYEAVSYYTDPELPGDSFFLKAQGKGDSLIVKETSETVVASVSVIGGSSGPTSIFIAGKKKEHTVRMNSVCSPLFFQPTPVRDWYICYRIRRREPFSVALHTV